MDIIISSRSEFPRSAKVLLCIVFALFAIQGFSAAQQPKQQKKAEPPSPGSVKALQDPYAAANRRDLSEIEIHGPGGRYTLTDVRTSKVAVMSGCFTLKQTGSISYSYRREFISDTVYFNMLDHLGGGKMVQVLEIGKETIFSVSFSFGDSSSHDPDLPFQATSIIRFEGKIEIAGYLFFGEGIKEDKLTFAFVDPHGLIYLRGKGRVVPDDGDEVILGE